MSLDHPFEEPTAIRTNLGALFVSLELSRSPWLITSLSPTGARKCPKHGVSAWNVAALLARLSDLKQSACADRKIFSCHRHSRGGVGRVLDLSRAADEGVESHVVDPASIAASRRRRRAKTDKIDGEALVRYRTYIITTRRITSGKLLKYRNGLLMA